MVIKPKLTEADVLRLLRDKHTGAGNGGSGTHAFLTHVRDGAAFDSKRTFDGVGMDLWPSRGLAITVFEVKVSRSDWQRELAKPEKAQDAFRVADQFVIVAPTGCVKDGELPPDWGLWEVTGDGTDVKPWKIRSKVAPKWIGPPTNADRRVDRGFLVGLLRAAPGAVPGGKVKSADELEVEAARSAGYEQAMKDVQSERVSWRSAAERDVGEWKEAVAALESAGVRGAGPWTIKHHADAIAAAIADSNLSGRLRRLRDQLADVVQQLDETLDPTGN